MNNKHNQNKKCNRLCSKPTQKPCALAGTLDNQFTITSTGELLRRRGTAHRQGARVPQARGALQSTNEGDTHRRSHCNRSDWCPANGTKSSLCSQMCSPTPFLLLIEPSFPFRVPVSTRHVAARMTPSSAQAIPRAQPSCQPK